MLNVNKLGLETLKYSFYKVLLPCQIVHGELDCLLRRYPHQLGDQPAVQTGEPFVPTRTHSSIHKLINQSI